MVSGKNQQAILLPIATTSSSGKIEMKNDCAVPFLDLVDGKGHYFSPPSMWHIVNARRNINDKEAGSLTKGVWQPSNTVQSETRFSHPYIDGNFHLVLKDQAQAAGWLAANPPPLYRQKVVRARFPHIQWLRKCGALKHLNIWSQQPHHTMYPAACDKAEKQKQPFFMLTRRSAASYSPHQGHQDAGNFSFGSIKEQVALYSISPILLHFFMWRITTRLMVVVASGWFTECKCKMQLKKWSCSTTGVPISWPSHDSKKLLLFEILQTH
jgi:hypothetical protein